MTLAPKPGGMETGGDRFTGSSAMEVGDSKQSLCPEAQGTQDGTDAGFVQMGWTGGPTKHR